MPFHQACRQQGYHRDSLNLVSCSAACNPNDQIFMATIATHNAAIVSTTWKMDTNVAMRDGLPDVAARTVWRRSPQRDRSAGRQAITQLCGVAQHALLRMTTKRGETRS
jgi:hypothetical protein